MAARAYWQGQIRLALVSIPVQVFPATKSAARISFNQIHKPSGKRIRYQKVVPGVGEAAAEDIVKGYEVEKGKYVLITEDEIDDVKLEAKKTLDLIQFVDANEVEFLYIDKPYYVSPEDDATAGEAYVVLREALKATGKVGIGHIVARGHSNLVALRPSGKGLMIETLRYADEVHKPDAYFAEVPDAKPEPELLSLAEELIERKVKPFDPKAFSDPYEAALRELIEAKVENRPPESIDEPQIGAKVIDLMEALKKSVGGKASTSTKKAAASAKKPAAKKAPAGKSSAKSGSAKKTSSRGRRAA
ncbi:non-homologous end joining protein Ku [Bauldia litoralis]|uniref:Non-homologous end joining protein Ku n=1 Tax=Bauldia litoralis TaxID=665467 RepID=A0A1G6B5U1_9HYPH|nr:Ku protein [Bauldia litoralis]SDB16038.1 DNA end-binding protein Ku [Bauldia litoralis]